MQPDALSSDAIVDAALAVIRRAGLPALTVRAVADELGVTGPALYYHVPGGKASLVTLVMDRVTDMYIQGLEFDPAGSWMDHIERVVSIVCQAEAGFHGVMHLIMSAGQDHHGYVSMSEAVFRLLVDDARFAPDDAARILDAIIALVVGWIDHQMPSPAAARAAGHEQLADAVTRIEQDDPNERLLRWLRGLLAGFDHLRHESTEAST